MARPPATTGPAKPWPTRFSQTFRGPVAGHVVAIGGPEYTPFLCGPRTGGQSAAPAAPVATTMIATGRIDPLRIRDTIPLPAGACGGRARRTRMPRAGGQMILLLLFALAVPQVRAERPDVIFERAVADFLAGRIPESVDGFDRVARLDPDVAPQLWQRGIALYYAGRYQDCRRQFESHRTVNPDDVENAAWHFLCVARGESPRVARAALLPVGPDSRTPMTQIYQMFRGDLSPEAVLAAAGDRADAQFYAHLYVGLYFEAVGNRQRALEQITAAADERYAAGGFMHTVAKNHLKLLRR